MNIEELERKINAEQAILYQYEDQLRLEDDPRRKAKLQTEIEASKITILGLQTKLAQRRAARPKPPTTTPGATARHMPTRQRWMRRIEFWR